MGGWISGTTGLDYQLAIDVMELLWGHKNMFPKIRRLLFKLISALILLYEGFINGFCGLYRAICSSRQTLWVRAQEAKVLGFG